MKTPKPTLTALNQLSQLKINNEKPNTPNKEQKQRTPTLAHSHQAQTAKTAPNNQQQRVKSSISSQNLPKPATHPKPNKPQKPHNTKAENNKAEKTPTLPLRNPLPPISFPEELPVSGKREEIAQAILNNQVIILCGETGSGKTTQLPKICLSLGRGTAGLIGHTQPRRIAASSTAKRIAQELGSDLGVHVGYKVRFNDTLSKGASVKLMTDGILLAETQGDPLLRQYDTIIIDEAHERSLNIDFLLGYLKQLLPQRPDLKVIITSATIDANRFATHFGTANKPAPVLEVSGRLYPVDIRYRPIQADQNDKERDLMTAITDAIDECCRIGSGDVLVFLPGEREIRDAAEALRKHHPPHVEILPLFARLSAQEQERVFKITNARRIVLATNVAETSLTVPGIRFVVDTGLARVKRYSYRNKVEQLQIEPIAQSAANQRAGRCGRVAAGVCIRLYDEPDFVARLPFTEPEILRSSLAAVILRMRALHFGDVENFPFIEAPQGRAIADGYQLLQELGALDDANKLTQLGIKLAKLPLDPRIGRMILAGVEHHALAEVLIIAAALSVQDPRDRPLEAQAAADLAHKKFADDKSEFTSYLKMWAWFANAIEHKKSNKQLQQQCREQFLSQLRLREWREVHSQLLTITSEQNWRVNAKPATYEQLHLSLLTGLLGNIGFKGDEATHYLGARGIKFNIWPGSHLIKKAGRWIMAAELVDTSRLYARCIAQIQPEWLEKIGSHLLRKNISDPKWEKRANQVSAFERATLYGLVVYSQRRIHFGATHPVEAREIFIRDALVVGEYETRAPFYAHNQQLLREIENLEHKSRRTDVLVDESLIAAFYDQYLPQDIINGITFEHWYKSAAQQNPKILYLKRDDLMRHEAAGITTDVFPKKMLQAGTELQLSYHFEPGSLRDGVTLTVPLFALNQISAERCEWLVPGMIKEKVQVLLKSLPQKIRRHCVPIPDYAAAFCERTTFAEGVFLDKLMADIQAQTGLQIKASDFKFETIPAHLTMNFKIVDEHSRQLEMGRNLASLKAELGTQARASFQKIVHERQASSEQDKAQIQSIDALIAQNTTPSNKAKQAKNGESTSATSATNQTQQGNPAFDNIHNWSFGELPELLEIAQGKQTLIGYPALVDKTTNCQIQVFDDANVATSTHLQGLRRLFALQLKDQVKFLEKNIPNLQQMGMQYMSLGSQEELRTQIIDISLSRAFLQSPLPINAEQFSERKEQGRARLNLLTNEIARLVGLILTEYFSLPKKLQGAKSPAISDMQSQLQALMHKHFLAETPYQQLTHYPRYLKAIHVRLEKMRGDAIRDTKLMQDWQSVAQAFNRIRADVIANDAKLQEYRWLLEELRVSLFAQELKTPMPVSAKRLQKVWESLQR